MIDRSVHTQLNAGLIPRGHLLIIAVALLAMIADAMYISLNSFAQNSASPAVSGSVSSRLASAPDQVNTEGNVTVRVTWVGPEAGPVFNVVMDTHSVDLDPYDLGTMVVLQNSDGRESAVINWDAPKGGHHRKGKLVFSELALDGKLFVAADRESIQLVIYDLSGVPTRTFTWNLK